MRLFSFCIIKVKSILYLTCILTDEYIFIVLKKDTNSSKRPKHLPPALAKMSPILSHVQCGRNTVLSCSPFLLALSCTASIISYRNWWNVLLHRPKINTFKSGKLSGIINVHNSLVVAA